MGDDFETLVLRVARLETQSRRFKQAGSLVAVLLLTTLVLGQAKPAKRGGVSDTVRAREFVLIDEDGNERGSWDTFDDGAFLTLKGGRGQTRVMIVASGGSSSIETSCEERKYSIVLGVLEHDKRYSSAIIFAQNQRPRTMLAVFPDGSGKLSFKDRDGKERAVFGLPDAGHPSIVLRDKNGKTRAVLGTADTVTSKTGVEHKYPESSLLLFDKDENVLFEAP